MAPSKTAPKRKAEPFYYKTIEDDEEVSDEQSDSEDEGLPANKRQHMNPDFVWEEDDFGFGGLGGEDEDNEAQKQTDMEWIGAERIVDLSAIIQRKREKREGKAAAAEAKKANGKAKNGEVEEEEGNEEEEGDDEEEDDDEKEEDDDEEEDDEEDDDELDVDLDDEVLAEDGFGMGADSDEEDEANGEAESNEDEEETGVEDDMDDEDTDDEDDGASDNDSVATPIGHPDDHDPASDSDASSDSDDEETARQKAFFADGEKEKLKAKKNKKGKGGADSDDEGEDGNSLKSVPTFESMRIFSRPILRGVAAAGFARPTKIQAKTMPFAVGGKDVVGQAVTGSGKTAAFLLPILERLLYRPSKVPKTRVVILTPTRELAVQCHAVAVKLAQFTSITMVLAVGGTSFKATEPKLRARPDIVIGTPGRFIDHMRNTPGFAVDATEILVLDEADRMLQDGFADELNEIVKFLPRSRQTMLFSATMTAPVDDLIRVGMLRPVRVAADGNSRTAGTLTQEFVRLRQGREGARLGYLLHLCTTLYRDHTIIFFREKRYIHEARVVFGLLGLTCEELHGNIKQAERSAALESFRRGAVSFLLASDLASRGLDIKGVQTVINYEVPKTLDDYIHRIGRTARAGHRGVAVTLVAEDDRKFVRAATKAMRKGETGEDGKPTGTKYLIKSRSVDPASAAAWQAKIDDLEDDIGEIIEEEREARKLAMAEMEVMRGENLLKHREEILARPKKTWFETPREKEAKKQAARRGEAVGNGGGEAARDSVEKLRDKLKHKRLGGKLSNKDMKKLDNKAERLAGMGGKKLKQEKKALGKPGSKPSGKPGGKPGGKPKPSSGSGRPASKPAAKPASKPAGGVAKPSTGGRVGKGPKGAKGGRGGASGGRGGRGGQRGGKR